MNITQAPDRLYAELFEQVQSQHVFPDSKTFVDARAKSKPVDVLDAFRAERDQRDFDLAAFVSRHFEIPVADDGATSESIELPVEARIEQLWEILTRSADEKVENSSLIPLPNPYVVPGGRFREVYYWDSYFTMLGLADSGRVDLIRDMVENFAYLIDEIGFIPNGNRTYFCSRSQPPFFSLMVELLADVRNDDSLIARFHPQLQREYDFWMSGADTLEDAGGAHRRVVSYQGARLNRYWDDEAIPRQESYAEDIELAAQASRDPEELYRDIRAVCESGWDFSSRWFVDRHSKETIRATQIVPVDLNSLLYKLESMLADNYRKLGDTGQAEIYDARAAARRQLLQTLFFDAASGMFVDLALPDMKPTGTLSIAAAYPLYLGIATPEQAERVTECIDRDFLQPGGWLSTLNETGQQWDSPNGWAPMQWITYCGLVNYGHRDEARKGAVCWVDNNLDVYRSCGRLLEKYNVMSVGTAGAGGEYEVQDGFGWTNAVLLRFMQELGMLS